MGWGSDNEKQAGHGKERKTDGRIKILENNETKKREEYYWWTWVQKRRIKDLNDNTSSENKTSWTSNWNLYFKKLKSKPFRLLSKACKRRGSRTFIPEHESGRFGKWQWS